MRPLEALLSVANLAVLGAFTIAQLRTIPWLRYAALIAVLIAGLQVFVEGSRWPMVPAYALTVSLLVVGLLGVNLPGGLGVSRVVTGVGVGLGVVALLLATALPLIFPIFQLKQPDGPYPIGTVTYHWVDNTRHELFSTDSHAQRELMVQVWYPAQATPAAEPAPYVRDARSLSPALARLLHLPGFIFDYWTDVPTHATPSVPMASANLRYPVLIFVTGLDGFRQSNTFQVEELVSHGYVVAAIDQPYAAAAVSFPDGHQIPGWTKAEMQPLIDQSLSPSDQAPTLNGHMLTNGILPYFAQDVSFTLDQLTALDAHDPNGILTGRLDLQRVGTFGISLGAMVAGEACHADSRLKACLLMDAAMPADVVKAGLSQPSMWITRDAGTMRLERQRSGGWTEAEIAQTLSTERAVFDESQPGHGFYLQMPGMFHVNFTDAPYWSPLLPVLGLIGPMDAQRGFAIANAYSLAFFDQALAGRPAPLLAGPSPSYPDVLFEAR
jgi:predicted dienelactone hydrolase